MDAQQDLGIFHNTFLDLTIYNSRTQQPIQKNEGVTCNYIYTYFTVYYDRYENPPLFGPCINYFHTAVSKTEGQIVIQNGEVNDLIQNAVSIKVTIMGPTYETQVIEEIICPTNNIQFYKKSSYPSDCRSEIAADAEAVCKNDGIKGMLDIERTIYLVPKRTVLEGDVNINMKSESQTNDLGLLTTKSIASGLQISEEEVIKLITSGQLKGKKIGDKYFVRKEDFDAFMKK
jgi:excisionase family DNA binding protein